MFTYFTAARANVLPRPAALPAFAERFSAWTERRRDMRRIAAELDSYSDRHLAELGLRRSDIADVARGTFARR